jgi:hypothetical protein
MKTINAFVLCAIGVLTLSSCSNDDPAPEPINEEEIITTFTATLIPQGGGTTITLQTRDLDGDGPNPPVVEVSGDFLPATVYDGTIVLLNETETPAENITDEVEEEDTAHQFFYTVGGGLDVSAEYANFDSNNNPLGTAFTLTTGATSSGTLAFTLRHEPTKPNTGLSDAGGETDLAVTFNVNVQ